MPCCDSIEQNKFPVQSVLCLGCVFGDALTMLLSIPGYLSNGISLSADPGSGVNFLFWEVANES